MQVQKILLLVKSLKDIAEYLGVHYSTVSRAIKRVEQEDEKWHCKT
ncbi:MAG TPA: hypothetical protein DCK79_09440 [Candidatus Atribacteria bacterium]|nr:hypothetical protein [Candidatus Atribacteria bacterium]